MQTRGLSLGSTPETGAAINHKLLTLAARGAADRRRGALPGSESKVSRRSVMGKKVEVDERIARTASLKADYLKGEEILSVCEVKLKNDEKALTLCLITLGEDPRTAALHIWTPPSKAFSSGEKTTVPMKNLQAIEIESEKTFSLDSGDMVTYVSKNAQHQLEFVWWLIEISRRAGMMLDHNLEAERHTAVSLKMMQAIESSNMGRSGGERAGSTISVMQALTPIQIAIINKLPLEMTGNALSERNESILELPKMTVAEEKDMQELLAMANLQVSNIDQLEDFLSKNLAQTENELIQSFFSPEAYEQTDRVVMELDQAIAYLDLLDIWIGQNAKRVEEMRTRMRRIERRNTQLEIQSTNFQALQDTLQNLVGDLKLSQEVVHQLQTPDFRKENLPHALAAAAKLDVAISKHMEGGLEKMEGVRTQRAVYATLKTSFANAGIAMLEQTITDLSVKLSKLVKIFRDQRVTDPSMVVIASRQRDVHAPLMVYLELGRYLGRMDPRAFIRMRDLYVDKFGKVYALQVKCFFEKIIGLVRAERKEGTMATCADYVIDEETMRRLSEVGLRLLASNNPNEHIGI